MRCKAPRFSLVLTRMTNGALTSSHVGSLVTQKEAQDVCHFLGRAHSPEKGILGDTHRVEQACRFAISKYLCVDWSPCL